MTIITIPTHKGKGGRPKVIYEIIIDGEILRISTQHKLYNLRYKMIDRCYNAKPEEFAYYQGKNIKVCEEWINNPETFFKFCFDKGWKPGLQLDRINPNGNYEPDNVRMITASENASRALGGRYGEQIHNAKLNKELVLKIREMLKDKISCYKIAKLFNVSQCAIQSIKSGKTWSHI